MARYRIVSDAGVDMGIFEGSSPATAIAAMARYYGRSEADLEDFDGSSYFSGTATRIVEPEDRMLESMRVSHVDRDGVTVRVGGEDRWVSWDDLRAAADDNSSMALRDAYRGILRRAEAMQA